MSKQRPRGKDTVGRNNLIDDILKVAKDFERIPIRNYRKLAPLVPCSERCLDYHYLAGKHDDEKGIESKDVQFFRMIQMGKSLAYMRASQAVAQNLNHDDARTAFKYLAIVDPENWTEKKQVSVEGSLSVGVTMDELLEGVDDDE